jgi:cyclophilin family peptidyl-prolyl cis-trans isomerase
VKRRLASVTGGEYTRWPGERAFGDFDPGPLDGAPEEQLDRILVKQAIERLPTVRTLVRTHLGPVQAICVDWLEAEPWEALEVDLADLQRALDENARRGPIPPRTTAASFPARRGALSPRGPPAEWTRCVAASIRGMKTPPRGRWFLPLVLLPIVGPFGGCASAPAASPGRPAGPAVLSVVELPDLAERAVLLLLVDRQMLEPVALQRALAGGPELRERTAEALGQIGNPRAVDALRGLALDSDPRVRRAAVFALGELEDEGGERALLPALRDPDREVGVLAVEALAKLGTPVARVDATLAALPADERWARLLPSLFRFDEDATVPLAEAGLAVADPALHARAAYALARNPRPAGAPALRRLVTDPDPWVRGWAARGLGRVGDGSDPARLRPFLDDAAAGPVIQALRAAALLVAAGKAAPPDDWRGRVVELLADPRPQVRLTTLEVAGTWLLDEALGAALIERAAGRVGDPWERAPALLALARGQHPRAAELAEELGRAFDPTLRAAAAEAAALTGAAPLVERLTHDPHARVRIAALAGWLDLVEQPAEAAATALRDPDTGVRAQTLSWLETHPVVPVEILGEAMTRALTDRNAESSLAGVRALAARAEVEPLERGTLVAVLERLAESADFLVRRAAVEALGRLGRPQPPLGTVESDRPVAAYESVLLQAARQRVVDLETSRGTVTLTLDCPRAPLTCHNFLTLAAQGFYDGLPFHRVVPDFVVQGGDPRGDGFGGPPYTLRDEINRLSYDRGVVGMALAGPDTGGSQFFITLSPQPHLDGGYTAFGRVTTGFDVLERIVPGDTLVRVREREPR